MSTTTTPAPDTIATNAIQKKPVPPGRRLAIDLLSRYALVLLWIVMLLVLLAFVPGDVSPINAMRTVFSQITPVVFLGLGVVITMAVGEFDLSFAGIFSISAVAVP